MGELNTRLRSDPALQAAMGRRACAEQSVVQQTLDAYTPENVAQMYAALDVMYRRQAAGYRHDYAHAWQLLDVDMSGAGCRVARRRRLPATATSPTSGIGAGAR